MACQNAMASESTMICHSAGIVGLHPGIAAFAQYKSCGRDQLEPELSCFANVMCIFCEQQILVEDAVLYTNVTPKKSLYEKICTKITIL